VLSQGIIVIAKEQENNCSHLYYPLAEKNSSDNLTAESGIFPIV